MQKIKQQTSKQHFQQHLGQKKHIHIHRQDLGSFFAVGISRGWGLAIIKEGFFGDIRNDLGMKNKGNIFFDL